MYKRLSVIGLSSAGRCGKHIGQRQPIIGHTLMSVADDSRGHTEPDPDT